MPRLSVQRVSQPKLTVIVPRGDDDSLFESSLLSVLENRTTDHEVIVAHDGSYSDPYGLGFDEVTMVAGKEKTGLIGLLNQALDHVESTWLQVLIPGTSMDRGFYENAKGFFDDEEVVSIAPRTVTPEGRDRSLGGLETQFAPRRIHRTTGRSGDRAGATFCGGFFRTDFVRSISGWLDSGQPSTVRETAEMDFALAAEVLRRETVYESESVIYAPRKIAEGTTSGYALGHDAGRLAVAYSRLEDATMSIESMTARLSHLATGLVSLGSIAERLGWVVGCNDGTLAPHVMHRIENARRVVEESSVDSAYRHYRDAA